MAAMALVMSCQFQNSNFRALFISVFQVDAILHHHYQILVFICQYIQIYILEKTATGFMNVS